jgi:glutamate synthase domain-containing protein 2
MLNCSALSFGPIGKKFILAVNRAARRGGFFQNTGEAGISPYHFGVDIDTEAPGFDIDKFFRHLHAGKYPQLEQAGDVVWQLGTGYFGCRNEDGSFDPEQFRTKALLKNVKMIELKLSQGVEPGKALPVKQMTPGIAKVMGVRWEGEARLQDKHSAFSTPIELLHFIDHLRQLSDGKPVGLKIGLSHRQWFLAICKAMLKTGILIDFITVDGMEAGSSGVPKGASGFTGNSLDDALVFIHNALVGTNLRKQIKIIASGRVFTEQDIISKLARGADLCSTARGMMLAAGCDQQRECYKGTCFKGIATQDTWLLRNFDTDLNEMRIYNYHHITIEEFIDLLSIAGVRHPSQIGPFHVQKRITHGDMVTLDEVYDFLKPGVLLSPWPWMKPKRFRRYWSLSKPDQPFLASFDDRSASIGR